MSTPPRNLASLLRAAWLLAGILALIAGILGMHVLTSGHSSHAAASAGPVAAVVDHATTSPGHMAGDTAVAPPAAGHPGHGQAAPRVDTPDPAPSACGGTCPGLQESGAPCIPSAPNGSVTLYPPQAAPAAVPAQPGRGSRAASYSYSPPSPTPCELSISRT